MTILDLALESENIYREMARVYGLDKVTTYLLYLINNPLNKIIIFYDSQYPIAFVIFTEKDKEWFGWEMVIREKYRHTGILQQWFNMGRQNNIEKIRWTRTHIRNDITILKLNKGG